MKTTLTPSKKTRIATALAMHVLAGLCLPATPVGAQEQTSELETAYIKARTQQLRTEHERVRARSTGAGDGPGVVGPETPEEVSKAETIEINQAADAHAKGIEDTISTLKLSAGIAAIYVTGDAPIESATAEPGEVLNVTRKSNARVGPIFEAHFLREDRTREAETQKQEREFRLRHGINMARSPVQRTAATETVSKRARGWMVAVEVGEDLVKSFGVGYMWAWRNYELKADGSAPEFKAPAFNLGILAMVDPHVKKLGHGLTEGEVVPDGVTIRLDEEARLALGVVFSVGF